MSEYKNLTCMRCGNPLEAAEFYDEESKSFICPNCGTIYIVEEDDVYKDDGSVKDEDHGFDGLCLKCGKHMILTGNFMRSEVLGDVEEEYVDENGCLVDDSMTMNCTCPHCGTFIEVIPCKPSEEKDYPFFKENENGSEQEV